MSIELNRGELMVSDEGRHDGRFTGDEISAYKEELDVVNRELAEFDAKKRLGIIPAAQMDEFNRYYSDRVDRKLYLEKWLCIS